MTAPSTAPMPSETGPICQTAELISSALKIAGPSPSLSLAQWPSSEYESIAPMAEGLAAMLGPEARAQSPRPTCAAGARKRLRNRQALPSPSAISISQRPRCKGGSFAM